MAKKSKTTSAVFKAKVALAALAGDKTLAELAQRFRRSQSIHYAIYGLVQPVQGHMRAWARKRLMRLMP